MEIMLKNTKYAGRAIQTEFGRVEYDAEGITSDLTKEQEKEYEGLKGYEIIEDSFPSEDKETEEAVKEVDEDTKEDLQEDSEVEAPEYTKTDLNNLTVPKIDALAEDIGINLEGSIKKEKIQEILDAQ